VDGRVVPAAEGVVGVSDRGLLLGEGVFETCKVVDGTPFALTRHLARLRRSAATVGLTVPWDDALLRSACGEVVGAGGGAPGRLRITVTGGPAPAGPRRGDGAAARRPQLVVTGGPVAPLPPFADVVAAPWSLNERSPSAGAKTTSYVDNVLALADAQRRGADEAVLTNTAGFLAEATTANLFLVADGVLCTPSLRTGCLPGVTRELVTEVIEVVERHDLTIDDLHRASEAFLTSSLRDVLAIRRVDGRAVGSGPVPGARTAEAAAALAALEGRTLDP
jgi:branched-chain amino acid aminotransferase